jgi:hypothetical protein
MKLIPCAVLLMFAVGSQVHAQSLADAAAEAAKTKHEWAPAGCAVWSQAEQRCVTLAPIASAGPPLTAAELGTVDRSKFAGVHLAASAATDAFGLDGLAGKTEAVRTMREYKTAAGLALEQAVTPAEKALAQQYYDAQFDFEMSDRWFELATARGIVNHETLDKSKDLRKKAWASLKAADKTYLGK